MKPLQIDARLVSRGIAELTSRSSRQDFSLAPSLHHHACTFSISALHRLQLISLPSILSDT